MGDSRAAELFGDQFDVAFSAGQYTVDEVVEAAYATFLGLTGDFVNAEQRKDYWVGRLEGDLEGEGLEEFAQQFLTQAETDQGNWVSDDAFQANQTAVDAVRDNAPEAVDDPGQALATLMDDVGNAVGERPDSAPADPEPPEDPNDDSDAPGLGIDDDQRVEDVDFANETFTFEDDDRVFDFDEPLPDEAQDELGQIADDLASGPGDIDFDFSRIEQAETFGDLWFAYRDFFEAVFEDFDDEQFADLLTPEDDPQAQTSSIAEVDLGGI